MKNKIYRHPNVKSRLTIKRITENISTLNLIDEPKEYKIGIDKYNYKTIICDINSISSVN